MRRLLPLALALSCACATSKMTGKERGERAEKRGIAAERALDAAEAALSKLEPEEADKAIALANDALSDPTMSAYPEFPDLRSRAQAAEKRLNEVRAEVARRALAKQVDERKQAIEGAEKAAADALAAVEKPTLSRADVEAASGALARVRAVIADGEALEAKSKEYATYAKEMTRALSKREQVVDSGRKLVSLREGALKERLAAAEEVARAKAESDPEKQRASYQAALVGYKQCEISARTFADTNPELRQRPLAMTDDPIQVTAEGLKKTCGNEAKALDKTIAKLAAKASKPKAQPTKKK